MSLGRAGRVEHAQPLEVRQPLDRKPSVLCTRREKNGAGGYLVSLLEPNDVTPIARLQRDRAVRACRSGVELARLGDGSARQLGPRDSRRDPR